MLSERQLQAALKVFEERMQEISDEYLRMMGEHIRDLGKLTASDAHRLVQMKRMNANVESIKQRIAREMNASVEDVERVFLAAAESDARFMAAIFGEDHTPAIKGNKPLERILKAQLRITGQQMSNLSQTTLLSDGYRKAVDVTLSAVQAGYTDYNSAVRSAIRKAAGEGLRVQYPNSGLTRRLDTAVRQNILDGVRSINQDVLNQLGKEFGADGVEISAHALCAEDHLPYQGRQFSNKEFADLQNSLERQIGAWNCKHTAHPILLGISQPTYSDEELADFRQNSREEVEIDGRVLTRYEWSQEQRRLETQVRYQKDIAVAAKASGDDVLRREAQGRINDLTAQYEKISAKADLLEQRERMGMSGFRRVKAFRELSDNTRYEHADFVSNKLYQIHIAKHLREYGDISPEEYVKCARDLLRARPSDDILRLEREDGSIVKYRISTNDFAIGSMHGDIRTLFRPKRGINYWEDEVKGNGKN